MITVYPSLFTAVIIYDILIHSIQWMEQKPADILKMYCILSIKKVDYFIISSKAEGSWAT